jgi:hypothetical protein
MDPMDPQWSDHPGMKAFDEFLAKYFPEGNRADNFVVTGYNNAQTLVQVLKQCGDELTREHVMKQAANLKDFRTDNLLPGITINTSPTDFARSNKCSSDGSRGRDGSCSAPCSTMKSEDRKCQLVKNKLRYRAH